MNKTLLILYLMIVATQIGLDPNMKECKNKLGVVLIVFHHMLQWYFFIGSLVFGYHDFHMKLLIVALFIHLLYRICPLTIIHNRICKIDEKKPLITLLNHIVKQDTIVVYYLMIISVITYDYIIINKWM
jgi:hypothetical protein